MAAPDAAAWAHFALPLRREADAVIADANGQTVLIIDPSRNLDEPPAERIADLVFATLTAAPVREEGGAVLAVDDVPVWADGIVTDGERVAMAQKAEADHGGTYWAVDGGDGGLDWEPTHFISLTALATREEAPAEAGEIDLYDDKVQAGIAWTMRQWGETLGLKTWTMGDGSESVEGDVGAEIHTILVDAGLRDPETNEMAALRAKPQARS